MDVQIYYCQLPADGQSQAWVANLRLLPESMQAQAQRMAADKRRWNYVLGRRLLQLWLQAHGYPWDLQQWRHTAKGRPFLQNLGVDFSISHSRDWVVLAITQGGCLGVDMEQPRHLDWRLFKRYVPAADWQWLQSQSQPQVSLLRLWTSYEAVAKAAGTGLGGIPLLVPGQGGYWLRSRFWYVQPLPLPLAGVITALATCQPQADCCCQGWQVDAACGGWSCF